ncbi:dTDP-4-dehydrorhamnose reductase [Chroogloeocystis siderophila]|jgi:dTDP-4-dehydrorhamnose reductase|uniref:dTDP-4-dehydrorhamnose reductase n=1 Tax=Chroogloeocystis siderophila 5.2 s.c.1 TaxID=247279 RepID=A0A1U7HP92_9CHRO|nr:dTDP-4-dehydrorhamnose reductase [Chroogloeocystis siderophila]OKH25335.1 dTDP-4-dehydrorhamnose reductase [Chroogloeocystis siderophila 5.2 s.c.1]
MRPSILLIGNTGQLGQELQRYLAPIADVTAVGRPTIDLTQPDSLRQIIHKVQPQIIINAAAYTAVDKAETEPELATAINAIAPGILAAEAQQSNLHLIHISTDYVFDGCQSHPYQETDATNPLGVYGRSKLAGEQAIQDNCDRYIILRTAWVYGSHGNNFVKTMLRLGADRKEIRVVADQIGNPTWTGDITRAIAQLLEINPIPTGIYHYTNSGVASWYDFAIAIFEEAQKLSFPLKIQHVIPITTPEYPTLTQRPSYSVLACEKITKVLGTPSPHWRQGLRKMLAELYTNSYESADSLRR